MSAPALQLAEIRTDLLPDPLEYAALTPGDRGELGDLAVLVLLHGGNGSRELLTQMQPAIERAWADGTLPPAVVVTPSCRRSFYMNYRDGSERWEDAVIGPLLETACTEYGATAVRDRTAIAGISMGGMGALRIAFKHPDRFAAVAAMEPGIEPALSFSDIEIEDRFWRDDSLFERIYGSPVDEDYWAANNPANIARDDPGRLRSSGLAIAIECGDLDSFGLHRGAEFLHRILFDAGVSHDYHLVRGADHLGRTLGPRFSQMLAFIGRALDPEPPDDSLTGFHTMIAAMRQKAGLSA